LREIVAPSSCDVNEAIELMQQLGRDRFFGTVTFKFEAGRIVIINKNQTLKPSELPGHPGKRNNEIQQQQEEKRSSQ
jgi:hypothetical protein